MKLKTEAKALGAKGKTGNHTLTSLTIEGKVWRSQVLNSHGVTCFGVSTTPRHSVEMALCYEAISRQGWG